MFIGHSVLQWYHRYY